MRVKYFFLSPINILLPQNFYKLLFANIRYISSFAFFFIFNLLKFPTIGHNGVFRESYAVSRFSLNCLVNSLSLTQRLKKLERGIAAIWKLLFFIYVQIKIKAKLLYQKKKLKKKKSLRKKPFTIYINKKNK